MVTTTAPLTCPVLPLCVCVVLCCAVSPKVTTLTREVLAGWHSRYLSFEDDVRLGLTRPFFGAGLLVFPKARCEVRSSRQPVPTPQTVDTLLQHVKHTSAKPEFYVQALLGAVDYAFSGRRSQRDKPESSPRGTPTLSLPCPAVSCPACRLMVACPVRVQWW